MERIDISQIELNPFEATGKDCFLISAGDEKGWNTMTAGWGSMGTIWGKDTLFIFVRESRYTLEFLDKSDFFSVSFFPPERKDILSFCGSHSGRDWNKAEETGLTPVFKDGTVLFEEANLSFVLKKASKHLISEDGFIDSEISDRWYPKKDLHWMFVGFVEDVYVPETDILVVENDALL